MRLTFRWFSVTTTWAGSVSTRICDCALIMAEKIAQTTKHGRKNCCLSTILFDFFPTLLIRFAGAFFSAGGLVSGLTAKIQREREPEHTRGGDTFSFSRFLEPNAGRKKKLDESFFLSEGEKRNEKHSKLWAEHLTRLLGTDFSQCRHTLITLNAASSVLTL